MPDRLSAVLRATSLFAVLAVAAARAPAPAAAQRPAAAAIPERITAPPTGPYAIGVRDYFWVDSTRAETYTADPADRRHLLVRVWYPADRVEGLEPARYVPDRAEFGEDTDFDPVLHVLSRGWRDAPVAGGAPLPVLVYNHGGAWSRLVGSFTAEEMASHGYVVFGLDHPGFGKARVFPDGYALTADALPFPQPTGDTSKDAVAFWDYLGGIFDIWRGDAAFLLDRIEALASGAGPFQGRLDVGRIGMFGWSFGGALSVQMTRDDPRVRAAVDQDGQLFGTVRETGTTRPVLLLHGESPASDDATLQGLVRQVRDWDRQLHARSSHDTWDVTIAGASHGHFSDLVLVVPTDGIEPGRGHEIINAYTRAFFDRYLKELAPPGGTTLDVRAFPEVTERVY